MFFFNGFFILTISVVFGDNEYSEGFSISFSSKILTTFSISALFLLLLFLLFLSLPTDFGAPFKANALTDARHFDRLNRSTNCWSLPNFSAIAMTCEQIFVLLLMQLLSHYKRPCNNIGAVSCTRFFQDQTIIPHQRLGFFKHSCKNTQRNSIYSRIFG